MSVAILAPGSRTRRFSKRLTQVLVTLFGLLVLTFFIGRVMPVDPVLAIVGPDADHSTYQQVYQQLGFDKSLLTQFGIYLNNLLHGDFGNALLTGKPVLDDILRVFPATLELSVFAIVFAVVIGIPLGYWAARHVGRWQDDVAVVLSLVGVVVPVFFLAFILKWVFAVKLGWLPTDGRQDPRIDATHYTNFYVWDGIITAEWDAALNALTHLVLPGIALGTIVQGIEIENRAYAGGWYDWLTPFSIMTGVAVVVGYALLGSTWLVVKTEGPLNRLAARYAELTGIGTLVSIGAVSLWMPFLQQAFYSRWFTFPQILFVAPIPILLLVCAFSLFRSLRDPISAYRPFLSALGLFVLSYIGIGISFYPMMVPPSLTIQEAAAPDSSLAFTLVGAAVLIPMILAYTAYSYWTFRGKVREGEGYHQHGH